MNLFRRIPDGGSARFSEAIAEVGSVTYALQARIREIDERVAHVDSLLPFIDLGTYRRQELDTERKELLAHRRVAEEKYRAATAEPDRAATIKAAERRERFIQAEMRDRREVREAFIAKLEAQGDYRQARIHRMALLDLRAEIEREFPP